MKMKKIAFLATVLLCVSILCSCSSDGAPSGMKLISRGEKDGFYFYTPSEWSVSNIGGIYAAYASNVDSTSVSFVEIKGDGINDAYFLDEPTLGEGEDRPASDSVLLASGYFKDAMSEFPEDTVFTLVNAPTTFGKKPEENKDREDADRARRYEYNYTYEGHKYGFVQILIKEGERYFIFTFSSSLENRYDTEESFFAFHAETLDAIINSFRFVVRAHEEPKAPEYTRDEDGYILISDKDLSRFSLYVPDTFVPDYSSAIVSATHADGSNINMTEVVTTGVDIEEGYWKTRKEDLAKIVDNLVIIKEIDRTVQIPFGNASAAFECEYTYEYNGTKYHVYQIFAIDKKTFGYGYAFTYTASEENYQAHLAEIETITEKVKFK